MYRLSLLFVFFLFGMWSLFGPYSSVNYYGDALTLIDNLEIIASHGGFISMHDLGLLGLITNEPLFHLISVPLLFVTDNSLTVMNLFSLCIISIWFFIGLRLRSNITIFFIAFCPLYLITSRSTIPFTLCWSLIYLLFSYLQYIPVRSAFLLTPFCLLHWSAFIPITISLFYERICFLFTRVRIIVFDKNYGFSKIIPFILVLYPMVLAVLNISIYSSLQFLLLYPCALALLFLSRPSYSNIFDFSCLLLFLLSSFISPWAYRFLFFCPFVMYNLISSCKSNVRILFYSFFIVYSLLFYSIWSPLEIQSIGQ